MEFCPLTGEKLCDCKDKLAVSPLGSALMLDMKSALRKVFTDHVNYTSWLIIISLPIKQDSASQVAERLLRNPKDLSNLLLPIIGQDLASQVESGFKNHLLIAASLLDMVRNKDKNLESSIQKFYNQGDQVAAVLVKINQTKLSYLHAKNMMRQHNEYVVSLASLQGKFAYKGYIKTYDAYYKHILMFSDMIYETLTH